MTGISTISPFLIDYRRTDENDKKSADIEKGGCGEEKIIMDKGEDKKEEEKEVEEEEEEGGEPGNSHWHQWARQQKS